MESKGAKDAWAERQRYSETSPDSNLATFCFSIKRSQFYLKPVANLGQIERTALTEERKAKKHQTKKV